MANSFAITADKTEPIKLDAAVTAATTVIFTVTNTTNRPLRGIARVKALGQMNQEWISLSGERERDFPPHGTQQYTVTFNAAAASSVSAAAAEAGKQAAGRLSAGKYEFQLNVAAAANTDEDSADGPIITVIISEKESVRPSKFPWWIVPVAAVLLVGVGLSTYFLWPSGDGPEPAPTPTPTAMIVVEDVVGRQFPDAQTRLQGRGFVVVRENVQVPTKQPNEVDAQTPAPNAEAPQNSTVTLKVVEPATVPNLQGKTFVQAFDELRAKGLEIGNTRGPSETAVGSLSSINSQSPGANSIVAKGSKVDISFPCGSFGLKPCLLILVDPIRLNRERIINRMSVERRVAGNR